MSFCLFLVLCLRHHHILVDQSNPFAILKTGLSLSMATQHHTAESVRQALIDRLPATECEVEDQSGGCGAAFEISKIVSPAFAAKPPLARHRLVNAGFKEELVSIHALSIKQCLTPEEAAAKKEGSS